MAWARLGFLVWCGVSLAGGGCSEAGGPTVPPGGGGSGEVGGVAATGDDGGEASTGDTSGGASTGASTASGSGGTSGAGQSAGSGASASTGASGAQNTAAAGGATSTGGTEGDAGASGGSGSSVDTGASGADGGTSTGTTGDDPGASGTTGSDPDPGARELAVTANFLNKSLTVFDVGKLAPGVTRTDVEVASIDLGAYSPGPMSFNISPDGKLAIVSISAGFLGSFIDVPRGDDKLVFVDLEKYEVVGDLETGEGPMGVVFTDDGSRAFVGHFGENYFVEIDVAARTFERINTGASFNEELDIDDSGEVGILTYGPSGNVRTFAVSDPAGTLGQTRGLSGDAAGVAFFPGTKFAYLVQAPTILTGNRGGHDVIDVSDPARPVAHDGPRMGSHPTVYPATAVPARESVAYPSTEDGVLSLVEKRLMGTEAVEVQRVRVGEAESLAYGVGATSGTRVLVASSGQRYIGVVDLASGEAFTVPWEMAESGPTEVKVIP